MNLKKMKNSGVEIFSVMCKSITKVMDRQLADFLSGKDGIYSTEASENDKKRTSHAKITNIPAENLFGDLDYSIKRKHNATVYHHSSIVMLKRNKTVHWLKKKPNDLKSNIMRNARKKARLCKEKSKCIAKNVSMQRQEILRKIKQTKMAKQRKTETELRRIENSVKAMGGIVKNLRDIENLLQISKNLKEKK